MAMPVSVEAPVRFFPGADRNWADRILEACPTLRAGCRPPRWARNGHAQAALSLLLDDRAPNKVWDLDERLTMADGGTVSLQWDGLNEPQETPVLVVLHTLCGSGDGLRRFISSMRQKLGWVVVACNRRGHADLPLTAHGINTMGFVRDLEEQLDHIAARRPSGPLYGVGISAGSGLLVRYLGEKREASRFEAGIAAGPAYDIPSGLQHVHWGYDTYLTRKMIRFFLERNRLTLGDHAGFDRCLQARTMMEFHEHLYPLAGYESREAYEIASDPMRVAAEMTTPVLVLNAEDDPVCSVINVHRHANAMQKLPRAITALTRYGGHCGFFERAHPDSSWADRAFAEFLKAAEAQRQSSDGETLPDST
ncbi:alpha/beta fold hydrolase [Myxococcota bacterium]|nr:alpha/beta fold hydrolase [Myxococcota bacterium]